MDGYKVQLQQVELALRADPGNAELRKMAESLQQLITLSGGKGTKGEQKGKDKQKTTESKEAVLNREKALREWNVGEVCEAKRSDGTFAVASITSMSADRTKFTVTFKDKGDAAILGLRDLRAHSEKAKELPKKAPSSSSSSSASGANKKTKKYQSKADYIQHKEAEHKEKQTAWQKFNTKAVKRGHQGIAKSSIFKTADPSEKGMTENAKRTKHVFSTEDADE